CVMVPQRPFFSGSPGWVRSSAWIWLFSSRHSTSTLCGGFRYNPTTSVSFFRKLASRESLKVALRCGLRLCSCHRRLTVFLTLGLGHQPATPMGHALWLALQGC